MIISRTLSDAGLSIIEVLVILLVGFVLLLLILPISTAYVRDPKLQTLSNMKQLQLATQQMAFDRGVDTNLKCGWPGDIGGSFTNWGQQLVAGNYLSTNDLCKLLSAAGKLTPPGAMPLSNNNAVVVYNVDEKSEGNVVFLTSANFINTASGGLSPRADALPYGKKGFVIYHKAGDGRLLSNRQAGDTNLIGGFVSLCR